MKKKFVSIFLSLALVSSNLVPVSAVERETSKEQSKVEAVQKPKKQIQSEAKLGEKSGQVFLSGKLAEKSSPGQQSAAKFLDENKLLFGINSLEKDLKVIDIKKDEIGHTYVKYAQVINGIKVHGNLLNVHFDKSGSIVSVNGKLEENKSITTLGNKTISESEAVEIAKSQYTYKSLSNTPKAEKVIINKDNKNYEVYKVNISYMEPKIGDYDVFVEAHSGKVIQKENNIRYDGPVTGLGIDVHGIKRSLNLYKSGISYQMNDGTKSAHSITTYDLNNGTTTGYLVSNSTSSFNTEKHKASVSAHFYAGKVIDFYKNLFNRNSLDNNGMAIQSFTHYGYNYNNAFWIPGIMVYGDGDGVNFTYLSGDLDVVGHEMTHGVIDYTADLNYHKQSGALNESMADVFGVLISTYHKYNVAGGNSWTFNSADWVVGDGIYTPSIPGDALRSLVNPTLYDQPDNMRDYKNLPDTESGDNGGVHINSGIPNKAAYLIAKRIGMEKTARIYYRALVNYMNANTDFMGGKDCFVQAATDLYGASSSTISAIKDSFKSVGIIDDPYEPNNSLQTSYSIKFGTTYQSYISKEDDVDYYRLYVSAAGPINIKLSDLPHDYNLELYNSDGVMVDYSENSGTASEDINYYAYGAGNYYIKIYSRLDYSITQKYSLIVTAPVTGVNLNKAEANLNLGEEITLTAAVSPSSATNKKVTWSSDDTSIAAVNSSGKVTAVSEGTAIITATTADGGYTASCYVTVLKIPVTGVSLDKTTAALKVGGSIKLTAAISPGNATNKGVIWSSDNTLVATVNNVGIVAAVGEGAATITATTVEGGYTASCKVEAEYAPVTGVSLDKTTAEINVGESVRLTAILSPVDASNKNVTWSSSDPSVAVVNDKGEVTAVGKGTAVITVTTFEGGYTASCNITAVKSVTDVILNKTNAGLKVGESISLTATVTPEDASNKNITWTSSNSSVAVVNDSGEVTAVALGTAVITAASEDGIHKADCSIIVFELPAVPGSPKALSSGYNSIKISWNSVPGASGYEIYRSSSSTGSYSKIGESKTSSYTNTGLATGTKYYYKVRAYKTVWSTKHYGNYSSVTSAVPVLAIPSSPKAESVDYSSIKISWGAVPGASGYEIFRSASSTGTYSKAGESTALSYVNTGLATGTNYYYQVRAYRIQGGKRVYGSYSPKISEKPIPAAPNFVKAVSASYISNKITWGAVSGASGYEVYRASSSTGTYSLVGTTTSSSYTHQGLKTGTTYYYKVRAYRTVGTANIYGLYSAVVSSKPVPAAPSGLKAASASYNGIKISWSKVGEANGYEVYRAPSSTGTYSKVGATTALLYTNTGLKTGIAYYYKVRSYKIVGSTKVYSEFSSAITARPIPAVPTSLKAASTSYNSIKISWAAAGGASGYQVYRSTSSSGTYTLIGSTTATSYTSTGLTTNITYYYKIKSYNVDGSSTLYSSLSSATSTKPMPSVPASVKAASSSYTSIKVSWAAVSGASGYEVYKSTSKAGSYSKISTTSAVSYTNTGLSTGKTYYYKVRAYRTVGGKKVYSSYCAVVSGKPVPSSPSSPKAYLSAYNSIKISWKAVSGASGYQIYRATSINGTYALLTTTTATSYNNTKLPTNRPYYYKVRAYRTVGSTRIYGSYTPVLSAVTRQPYAPNYSTQPPYTTDSRASYVRFYLKNYGPTPIRVYSSGSKLIDNDYTSYNRYLQLVDTTTFKDISWIEFPSGSQGWVWFKVKGNPTWYDSRSRIYFEFTYDSIWYKGNTSYYYGGSYSRK